MAWFQGGVFGRDERTTVVGENERKRIVAAPRFRTFESTHGRLGFGYSGSSEATDCRTRGRILLREETLRAVLRFQGVLLSDTFHRLRNCEVFRARLVSTYRISLWKIVASASTSGCYSK